MDYAGIFFAKYLPYIFVACLIFLLIYNYRKYREMVLVSLFAGVASRFIIGEVIRFLWFRPRPFVSLNFIPLVEKSASEASFPSGHALFYFAVATSVYLYNKKLGIIFYVASFLICISRVFVGIHWPSDILAGALIGIFTALLIYKLFKKYGNNIFMSWRSV